MSQFLKVWYIPKLYKVEDQPLDLIKSIKVNNLPKY